ncbi:NAD(P)/FAD-dependent oxidoreductase [Pleionea sp. CnH1-48]|uniref:NAD(P)/FAD-dependent oxidoreductase n=1 Tax=Pleionea sp. CnH1-48 TaxID=2954494 RepID=UPI002096FB65|nr:NAD(P)/FAD-dependent oxidoreductase [Pleionea sp. CnH1-48]MCO7223698.1 NAD(P)/FAD-dependent oxidoreductase [Pleionea sp. CnH1-48]
MKTYDVVVVGAGAAGMMCAFVAAQRGRRVLLLEKSKQVGRKILMSGGGRCNFTNMYTEPDNFLSQNPHFCKSALSQYTQWDFIALVDKHKIPYHEKTLGQLFCDNKSRDIVQLLLTECERGGVTIETKTRITRIKQQGAGFKVETDDKVITCESLVVATGGLSIPSMGATGFGYHVAQQFGLKNLETRAALVPFVMDKAWLKQYIELAGVSQDVVASTDSRSFREAMLFTHKGVSGPSILQISSYWQPGESVKIDLLPDMDLAQWLIEQKEAQPNSQLKTVIAKLLSKRFATIILQQVDAGRKLADFTNKQLNEIAQTLHQWTIKPTTTEGYKTAEVTLGGVDTDALSSKTMMSKDIPGLFFIGEVVDVTGHLGGFNFQWAWSSGYVAGMNA